MTHANLTRLQTLGAMTIHNADEADEYDALLAQWHAAGFGDGPARTDAGLYRNAHARITAAAGPVIHFAARLWRDSHGNTYHTVTMTRGDVQTTSPVTYGYGSAWTQTAAEMIQTEIAAGDHGLIADLDRGLYNWSSDTGIRVTETVARVARKRDL